MSPVTRIGGGISVASRGLVLGEGIRVPVTAGGGPTPFLTDTLTNTAGTNLTAHVADSGATLAKHAAFAGDLVVSSTNKARCNTAGGTAIYVYSVVPGSAEYDITAVLDYVTTTGGTMTYGVLARMDGTAQTWYTITFASATGTWTLEKRVVGVNTSLGTYVGDAITLGVTRTLLFQVRNATKKVFIGGVERISSADNEITAAGRVGVRGVTSSVGETGIQIDSVTAVAA